VNTSDSKTFIKGNKMKWLILVDDYDHVLDDVNCFKMAEKFVSWKRANDAAKKCGLYVDLASGFNSPGRVLDYFEAKSKEYDHISLVYDGRPSLAGPAEMSFYSQSYSSPFETSAMTKRIIDRQMGTPLTSETSIKFFLEAWWAVLERFIDWEYRDELNDLCMLWKEGMI